MKKVLFVLPSHDKLGKTGKKQDSAWKNLLVPSMNSWYGYDVTIASTKGGQPPVDPKSNLEEWQTKSTTTFSKR